MKYALVKWSDGMTSIVTEEYIIDKTMLFNPEKEGMIVLHKENPQRKQKLLPGRVIYVSEQVQNVERQQKVLHAESAMSTNRKRQRTNSEDVLESYGKRPTMTNMDESRNGQEKSYNNNKDDLSRTVEKLHKRITKLEDELKSEKVLVKELQRVNLLLQKDLPNLLQQALQSCSVIQQLQTKLPCPTCSCNKAPAPTSRQQTPKSADVAVQSSSSDDTSGNETLNTPVSSPGMIANNEEHNVTMGNTEEHFSNENESKPEISQKSDSVAILEKVEALEASIDTATMMNISGIKSYKKMTSALLSTLFEKSILATSTVTGRNKSGRPALNQDKVEQIIAYVKWRYPETDIKEIKATMAQKCKDTRRDPRRSSNKSIKIDN